MSRIGSLIMGIIVLLFLMITPFETGAVALSPAVIELVGDRGEVLEQEIQLLNPDSEEKTYYLSTLKFEAGDEAGTPKFIPYKDDHSGLAEWISFPEREVLVPADGVSTITIKIAIPNDVESGSYFGAIVVSTSAQVEGSVSVETHTVALVLLTIQGETKERAEILDFTSGFWSNRLPIDFSLRVQNQGNIFLVPVGTISITNVFGAQVATIDVNSRGGRILPMSTRSYEVEWFRSSPTEIGFFQEIKNEWDNFALGPYRARVRLSYGSGEETLEAETSFWVFPWHLGLAMGLVLLVFVMVSWLIKRVRSR